MSDPQMPQKPNQPAVPAVLAKEPVIRTMPERYIGSAAGRPPVVREIVETRVSEIPPPAPPVAPKVKTPVKKTKRNIIIASVVVLLAGVGAVAYILLTPVGNAPPPPAINNNSAQGGSASGGQEPISNIPPLPVCGNGILETGEQCDDGVKNGAVDSGCSALCQIVVAPPPPPNTGLDSDSDGLTDVEETSIYGTDPHKLDADGDSFNDGNEVSHLYDPGVKSPAQLKNSKTVAVIENKSERYSLIVPAKWLMSGEGSAQFMATALTNEFFAVLTTDKPKEQSLVEWYLAMSPGTKADDVERFKTLQGYGALRSPDRLTTYIDAGDGRLFTLTYSFDGQTSLEFRTTYEALIASFTLLKP